MALLPITVTAPTPAAAFICQSPAKSGETTSVSPSLDQRMAVRQAWRVSTGENITVAVIGSGVSAAHGQLKGAVYPGFDFVTNTPNGAEDCTSEGTAAASLIAARPSPTMSFIGVAPQSYILPLRVTEGTGVSGGTGGTGGSQPTAGPTGGAQPSTQPSGQPTGAAPSSSAQPPNSGQVEPEASGGAGGTSGAGGAVSGESVAKAITYAVGQGATVVLVTTPVFTNVPELESAVADAQAKNALIITSTGEKPSDSQQALGGTPTSFPAFYPGVVSVTGIDMNGAPLANSVTGPYVKLAAPGDHILAATRERGHSIVSGSAYAASLVAGTAALVRAAEPKLTAEQVAQRLYATADPAAGAVGSPEYGYGIVDPYRAVTERTTALPSRSVQPSPPSLVEPPDELARQQAYDVARNAAVLIGLLVVVLALTAVVLAKALPAAKRRRWMPGWLTRRKKKQDDSPPPEVIIHSPQTVFKVPTITDRD